MAFTLTPFQLEKLEYFFKFFEPNEENNLVKASLDRFMERILGYTKWEKDSPDARECREVFEAFFEILFDKAGDDMKRSTSVSLDDWLSLWAHLIPGCKGMYNFPIWMRLLPKTLFRIIDRDQNGLITEDELCHFYKQMVRLSLEDAQRNSKLAYAQMTDNGRYPLSLDGYEQIFSNFMIGGTPYGPGRHIFGCFEHATMPFCLIAPPPPDEDVEQEVKIYLEKRPKRMSISELHF